MLCSKITETLLSTDAQAYLQFLTTSLYIVLLHQQPRRYSISSTPTTITQFPIEQQHHWTYHVNTVSCCIKIRRAKGISAAFAIRSPLLNSDQKSSSFLKIRSRPPDLYRYIYLHTPIPSPGFFQSTANSNSPHSNGSSCGACLHPRILFLFLPSRFSKKSCFEENRSWIFFFPSPLLPW